MRLLASLVCLLSLPSFLSLAAAQPCGVQQPPPSSDFCGAGQATPAGQVSTTCCWNGCTPTQSGGICQVQQATVACTGPTCVAVSIGIGDSGADYTTIQQASLWASKQVVNGVLQGGSACCNSVSCTAGLNSNCAVTGGLLASSITCPDITTEGTCTIMTNNYNSCLSPAVVVTNCASSGSSSPSSPDSNSNSCGNNISSSNGATIICGAGSGSVNSANGDLRIPNYLSYVIPLLLITIFLISSYSSSFGAFALPLPFPFPNPDGTNDCGNGISSSSGTSVTCVSGSNDPGAQTQPQPQPSSSSSSKALSTAQIVGIAISTASSLAGLAFAAYRFYYLRRMRIAAEEAGADRDEVNDLKMEYLK